MSAEVTPETSRKLSYFEDVLDHVGWGLYSKYLIAVGCLMSFSHATQILSLPLGLPFSTCNSLITNNFVTTVYIYFVCGKSVGGLVLNLISDFYGRKKTILISLVASFLALFTCAFTHTYFFVIIAALLLGSCSESLICNIKITISEVLTINRRDRYLVLFDILWTIGYIFTSVCSIFLVTTQELDKDGLNIRFGIWRVLFALTGGFSLFLACFSALMEESPRYLLSNRRYYITLLLIRQYFTINKSLYNEKLEIKESDMINLIDDHGLILNPEPVGCIDNTRKCILRSFKAVRLLFRRKFIFLTSTLILFNITIFFGQFNTHIFLTNLISKQNNNGTFEEYMDLHYIQTTSRNCIFEVNYKVYHYFLILSGAILFGKLLLFLIIMRVRQKHFMCFCSAICSLSFLVICETSEPLARLIISGIIICLYGIIESSLYIKSIEMYPTVIRSTGIGVTRSFGLAFFLIFLYEKNIPVNVIIWINSGLFAGAAILSLLLEDLTRKPMKE